jgi:glycosyltransferase involved in cell wall biosynthesis
VSVLKVAFDQQIFLLQEYGGISRYFCNLSQQLVQTQNVDVRVFAPLHTNRNLSAANDIAGAGYFLPQLHPKLMRLAMEVSKHTARFSINRFAPDILHETYFSYDDYKPQAAKRVLTVYDFIHERYSDMFENHHMTSEPKKAAALRADHVICISESTRRDLIEFCDVPEDRISVVYLGADVGFRKNETLTGPDNNQRRPYLLFVGNRGGYKNFDGFVDAFSHSPRLLADFDIVCFGGGPLNTQELQMAAHCGLRSNQITQFGGEDHVLAQLYQNAVAFIYPSFYEGFGIPPLEAMAAGCPVISSNTSSLPEVVGDAGEYFNPVDQDSMIAAMEQVLYSTSYCTKLIERGHKQESKFNWKKCADETLAIYRDLI